MGQTLSHGVYLPNEGERNCYAGLASNWQILNTAVGAIAEKAPLVHTHTVSQITDFPVYGTTAGTICEGNDSRLSDARTPVAHTHGKADITNLFNSANTWTNQNAYTVTGDVPIKITNNKDATNPSATEIKHIRFVDVNAKIIGGVGHSLESGGTSKMYLYSRSFSSDGSSNSNHGLLIVNNKQTGVHEVQAESDFIPSANNSYNLGSSSYQWNNLYAKNYYYNGVAWGLDKANAWSEHNRFNKNSALSDITSYTDTSLAFTGNSNTIFFNTRGSTNYPSYGTFLFAGYSTSTAPNRLGQLKLLRSTDKKGETNDGYKPDSSFNLWRVAPQYLVMDIMEAVRVTNDGTENSLKPITDNATDLGTSTNRFKSLNGINPGALSLPNVRAASADPISTVGWNLSGSRNKYTPTEDGWFYIRVAGTGSCAINIHNGDTDNSYPTWFNTSTGGYATLVVPCEKGISLYIYISATSIEYCSFHPCLGNV